MLASRPAKDLIRRVLARFGYTIGRTDPRLALTQSNAALSTDSENYLRPDNPRLNQLRRRYAVFDRRVTAPLVWTDAHLRTEDLGKFRGDNAYVWQLRDQNPDVASYAVTTYYLKSIDQLALLDKLTEDGLFGAYTCVVDSRPVSRDLLDSVNEIYFLERHLSVSTHKQLRVLDIGAGYGRLMHRMVASLPSIETYLCVDAYAPSTFLSEHYLHARRMRGCARVIALDEIESTLADLQIDLALNIHSFSECRLSAIDWWLGLLSRNSVSHLMIAPNSLDHGGNELLTNDRQDFSPLLAKHGYRLIAKEPKYRDPIVQILGIAPTYYYLFALHPQQTQSSPSHS